MTDSQPSMTPFLGLPPGRPVVAFGVGNAFVNFVRHQSFLKFDYAVDDFAAGTVVEGVDVRSPETLNEGTTQPVVVIFTLSSDVLKKIADRLEGLGFRFGVDVIDHAPVVATRFKGRMAELGIELTDSDLFAVRSLFWNLPIKNHSSVLGSWLMLALLRRTRQVAGDAVELGVYEGGNAFAMATSMALMGDHRRYHMVDSFEGFPELSEHDPAALRDMFRDNSVERVRRRFVGLDNAHVLKGFVPDVLTHLDAPNYSLVYYDCDLYEPAKAVLEHFWNRLPPGGVFIADDYSVTKDFLGVRKAVDEFFADKGTPVLEIHETTHAVVFKGGE